MRSLSDYRYEKFHFDCLKASSFKSEKPMGIHLTTPPPLGRSRVKCTELYTLSKYIHVGLKEIKICNFPSINDLK